MKNILLFVLLTFLLYSCSVRYTPPSQKYEFPRTVTSNKTIDIVFDNILYWAAFSNFQISGQDKQKGLINLEKILGNDFIYYCDCGSPGACAQFTNIICKLSIVIQKNADNQSIIIIASEFTAEKRYACDDLTYNDKVSFNSIGYYEKSLINFLQSK